MVGLLIGLNPAFYFMLLVRPDFWFLLGLAGGVPGAVFTGGVGGECGPGDEADGLSRKNPGVFEAITASKTVDLPPITPLSQSVSGGVD